jgi:hypothetical protein
VRKQVSAVSHAYLHRVHRVLRAPLPPPACFPPTLLSVQHACRIEPYSLNSPRRSCITIPKAWKHHGQAESDLPCFAIRPAANTRCSIVP